MSIKNSINFYSFGGNFNGTTRTSIFFLNIAITITMNNKEKYLDASEKENNPSQLFYTSLIKNQQWQNSETYTIKKAIPVFSCLIDSIA